MHVKFAGCIVFAALLAAACAPISGKPEVTPFQASANTPPPIFIAPTSTPPTVTPTFAASSTPTPIASASPKSNRAATATSLPPATATPPPFFRPRNGTALLEWARQLVQNVKPAETAYRHQDSVVTWAGQNGSQDYSSFTDCSGFVAALLTQTYGLTPDDFEHWLSKRRPLAENFYAAILASRGFQRISRIDAAKPGDMIAIKYPPGAGGDNTGHIMLINGVPQHRTATKPLEGSSEQWDVPIIDSSESGHGPEDTRHNADGTFRDGVGQGTLRIYSTSAGDISGYAWSDFSNSDYYGSAQRSLVIGRIDTQYR